MNPEDQIKLRQLILDYFSKDELEDLCFTMLIEFDDLPGETRRDKARELIKYCERYGRLRKLLSTLRTERPHGDWPVERTPDHEVEKSVFRDFWQLPEGKQLFCVVATADKIDTGAYSRPVTGYGELKGYASITYSLARAYTTVAQDAEIFFADTCPQHILTSKSLVLLGGTESNQATYQMLQAFKGRKQPIPFAFVDAGGSDIQNKWLQKSDAEDGKASAKGIHVLRVYDAQKGDTDYQPTYGEGRSVLQDFGVVARLPHPYASKEFIYLFAGCHTFGTAGAVKAIATKSILQKIEESCPFYDFDTNKYFITVTRCKLLGPNTFHVGGGDFYPLDERSLQVLSDQVVKDIVF